MTLFTRAFWKYAFERALKTFAQAIVGSIVGGTAAGATGANWHVVLISAVVAAGVSVLTSINAYTGPNLVQPQPVQPAPAPVTPAPADPAVLPVQ